MNLTNARRTIAAIRACRPRMALNRDFTLAEDGSLDQWLAPARFPRPTPEELATAPSLPEPVPATISPAQLGIWMMRHDIPIARINTAIAAIPDADARAEAQWRWERATEIRRDHPLVAALAQALGLSGEQTDQAFREAILL